MINCGCQNFLPQQSPSSMDRINDRTYSYMYLSENGPFFSSLGKLQNSFVKHNISSCVLLQEYGVRQKFANKSLGPNFDPSKAEIVKKGCKISSQWLYSFIRLWENTCQSSRQFLLEENLLISNMSVRYLYWVPFLRYFFVGKVGLEIGNFWEFSLFLRFFALMEVLSYFKQAKNANTQSCWQYHCP